MSEDKKQSEDNSYIESKFSIIEQRLDILHQSVIDMNSAIDMLVRFSMTAKAFMELSILQGMIDPNELNNLASHYETTYNDNLNIPETDTEYKYKFAKNIF